MSRTAWNKLAIFIALIGVALIVWDNYFSPYGEEKFDAGFFRQFDPNAVVDGFDRLEETGLFEVLEGAEGFHERWLRWPIGSQLMISPFCITVKEDSAVDRGSNTRYSVYWDRVRRLSDYGSEVSEELLDYEYLYTVTFLTSNGEIRYTQAGNSRRGCMKEIQENLLWLMHLVE